MEAAIRTQSRNWYDMGRNFLPKMGTIDFAAFAGKSNSFVYAVNPDVEGIGIFLTDKVDTAYVDLANKDIYIGQKLFTPDFYVNRFGPSALIDTEQLAIALINGAVIHEALHIRWTKKSTSVQTILEASGDGRAGIAQFGMQAMATAWNVIEDLFIEARVEDNLAKWIQATNDILFKEEDLDELSQPAANLNDALNTAIIYKNAALREHDAFKALPLKARQALESAASERIELTTVDARITAAYKYLMAFEFESEGGESDETAKGEGGESGETVKSDMDYGKPKSGAGQPIPDSTAEDFKEAEGLSEEEAKAFGEAIAETAKEVAEEKGPKKYYKKYGRTISWANPIEKDVTEYRHNSLVSTIEEGADYSFIKELRGMRTDNRAPGAARASGSVMVKSRLSRIATDNKIFAKNDSSNKRMRRVEIIILVDLSGSTMGSIISKELGAAKEMSKALRQARIPHAIYGHTSESKRTKNGFRDSPILIHIASYDMLETNQDVDTRFDYARRVRLNQNYDGVALEMVTNKFTGRDAARHIIVLSDGRPSGFGYSGPLAVQHTKDMVKEARRNRISVTSLSVVKDVVLHNDDIYGSQYNLNASYNLPAQFRQLIKKIAK